MARRSRPGSRPPVPARDRAGAAGGSEPGRCRPHLWRAPPRRPLRPPATRPAGPWPGSAPSADRHRQASPAAHAPRRSAQEAPRPGTARHCAMPRACALAPADREASRRGSRRDPNCADGCPQARRQTGSRPGRHRQGSRPGVAPPAPRRCNGCCQTGPDRPSTRSRSANGSRRTPRTRESARHAPEAQRHALRAGSKHGNQTVSSAHSTQTPPAIRTPKPSPNAIQGSSDADPMAPETGTKSSENNREHEIPHLNHQEIREIRHP